MCVSYICVVRSIAFRVEILYAPLLLYFAIATGTVFNATVGAMVVTVVVRGISAMKQVTIKERAAGKRVVKCRECKTFVCKIKWQHGLRDCGTYKVIYFF